MLDFIQLGQDIKHKIKIYISGTHTQQRTTFNGPFSRTTRVSRYQKGKTNLDFTEARDSEWQWHQLGHIQVCISLQTDNHASTPPLCFLQAGCPSCRPTNSVKALKAYVSTHFRLNPIWPPKWPPALWSRPADTCYVCNSDCEINKN